ncbi:MAG: hypothetical protein ABRQ39_32600 [Candidatus Eremiobacterota bacterium]
MSTKVLNVRISSELHKELKIQSALMEQNIKDLVEQAIIDFLRKVKNTVIENKEVNNVIRVQDNTGEENNIASSVNNWINELQEKKIKGLFDITKDPLYDIPAVDCDVPADFSKNIDNYIYGKGV